MPVFVVLRRAKRPSRHLSRHHCFLWYGRCQCLAG